MRKSTFGVLCLLTALLAGCAQGHVVIQDTFGKRVADGWTTPLDALGIDGTPASLSEHHNYRVRQVSSYDRTGGEQDDRYAQDKFDGGLVLADIVGPGAVLRIWTRNPWGTLMIFVDDMEHPLLTVPFRDLFAGDLELFSPGFNLFSPPFTGEGNGGYFCYVPIPFEERCRILVMGDEDVLAYQVTYAEFPPGAPIRSFELSLGHDDVEYFRRWRDHWSDYSVKKHDLKTERLQQSSRVLAPQNNQQILRLTGPGTITEVEMSIDSVDPDFLRKTWLAIYFDGQTSPGVLAPVGDLFGRTSTSGSSFESVATGNADGRMYLRYPMPFQSSAVARIINTSDQAADFTYSFIWREGPVDDTNYFFARFNSGIGAAGQPYRVLAANGAGAFAGAVVAGNGKGPLAFLEGDDMLTVDGEPAANFHGTGIDDYFNAGWHFATGPSSSPTHGCSVKVAANESSFSAYRNNVTDIVPFTSSFAFDLEAGADVEYTSVAYWYQAEKSPELWRILAVEAMEGELQPVTQ